VVRVALYYRVSTDTQAEQGYGLDVQRDARRAEAIRRGYTIIEEYTDEGVSGTLFDRPAMDRLREAASARLFEVVLCYRTSRLARDMAVKLRIKQELMTAA
jgi:site-specific DNA recombinase